MDTPEANNRRGFAGGSLYSKALALAKEKVEAGIPVLLYLKDMDECTKLHEKLKGESFIFDAMSAKTTAANLGVLDLIKKKSKDAPKVILTTRGASFGINFYPKCYPIMTEKPTTWEEY